MMKKAMISALFVTVCGYLGAFLGEAYLILFSIASATGCIVYAINHKNEK